MPVDVLDGDRGVVDQDADRQRQPPSVMMLMVSPSADSSAIEESTDSGIEMAMISVSASCRGTAGSSGWSAPRRSRLRAPRR
jgi:hypothetical protein